MNRMRIPLTLIAAMYATLGFAAEMSGEQARLAIRNWIAKDGSPMNARLGKRVRDARTYADKSGAPLFHVVRLDGGGFVVTAADDRIGPIVAISEGDDLVADERNPLWVLLNRDLPQRLAAAKVRKAQPQAAVAGAQLKDRLEPETAWLSALSGTDFGTLGVTYVSDVRVAPLVTSQWSQVAVNGLSCYNYYTPPYASGNVDNYFCGCVATAGAQLMRYHRYPAGSVSSGTYRCFVDGTATDLAMMGGVYNWDNMPLILSTTGPTLAQRQAIGKLTYDVGVASYMKYAASESGALSLNLTHALTSRFGYANAVLIMDQKYGVDSCVGNAILANLDAAQPTILGVKNSSNGKGHEIVADGYGYYIGDLAVHLNLGWSGSFDAWYFLPNIDSSPSYNLLMEIIYNISPSHSGEIISGRVLDPSGNPLAGASVVAVNQTTGVTLPTVTSNSKGIYCLKVPKPSGSHVYQITGYSGTYVMSQIVTVQASVSAQVTYDETTGNGYTGSVGVVGNQWGVDLRAGQTKIIGISGDLSFGSISVGSSSAKTMTISNTGNSALNVTSISYPTGFSGNWSSGSIAAGGSQSVTVTFSPTAVQGYSGTITVTSDKTSGTNTNACSGTGIQGPDGIVIVSPVGDSPQVGESSVVFRGKAPIGSTRVGYVNSTTGSSNSGWDTVESDGTWGGRSIDMEVGNNSITITSYNSSGSVTGSKALTVVRLSNIKTASIGVTTCIAFFSGQPKKSFNNESYVGYDSTGYGIERTLLQFAVSLPKGSSVTGGQLRGVTQNDSSQQHGTAFNVTAYMVNAAWGSGACWNSFIIGNAKPYETQGASTQSVPGANSWVYWDVTEICQYWYNGTPNYGFMLKAESAVENGTVWRDRWFIPDKYQLKIDYSVETTAPTISINSPTANSSYSTSSSTINLAGQASDSQNTVTVTWNNSLTGGSGNCAVNGNSWSVSGITLSAGVNRIIVTALDAAGNASTDVIEVTYIPPTKVIRLSGNMSFGDVIIGNQRTGELYINNDGDSVLSVTGITYPSGFSGDWNSLTIPTGGSKTVVVTFAPAVAQDYPGTITVSSDKTSGENTIVCSGTGLAATKTMRIEGDLAFGNVVTNMSFAKQMTIYNDGNSQLTVTGISYPTGFSGNWSGGTIPTGKSCSVAVAFEPTAVQAYADTITVSSDKTSGTDTITPSGIGIAATRTIRLTGDLSFGDITEGKCKTLVVTIHNDGNSDLTVSGVTCSAGFTCSWSGAISPGEVADMRVMFNPKAVQSYGGTITVNSDKTGGENTITCSGTGIAVIRRIRLAGNLNFGSAIEGEHVTRALTIFNDGDSALTITGVEYPAGFAGNWSCVIPEGASTNVVITFTPTAARSFGGLIAVNSDKTYGENTIACEGTGIGATRIPRLQGDLSFGPVTVGQSKSLSLTVHNDGNTPLAVSSVDCPAGFSAAPGSFTVGSNRAVTVSVMFGPDAVKTYPGAVQVNSDATAGKGSLDCSGTGTVVVDLAEALDNTNLVWESGGGKNWFGQVNVVHDGIDAAQSGAIAEGQSAWMQTTATGPGGVSFVWKVSSEAASDFLRFYIDGVEQVGAISGESGWTRKSYTLPDRICTLKWTYEKNASGNSGSDRGWVDEVVVSHGVAFEQASIVTTGEGVSGSGTFNAVVPVFGVGPASVAVYVLPGSAGASDYVAPSKPVTLTWADGQSGTTNVVIPIKGDRLVEGNEVFYLALGTPTLGKLGEQRVCEVTITDDDAGTVPAKGIYVVGLPQPPEGGSVSGGNYCLPGRSVKLTATAKTGWALLNWDNGSQVASRTVAGDEAAAAAQDGVMRCTALFKKIADLALPTSLNPGVQAATVGVTFELPLEIVSECQPKVTVTGLPTGLKYYANRVCISGAPTRAGTFNVTFTASNPKGSANPQMFSLVVTALPIWAQGTFNGAVGADMLGAGSASMSITAVGGISGKLSLRGTNYTFSAASYATRDENDTFWVTTTAKVAKVAWPLSLAVNLPTVSDPAGIVPGTLGAADGLLGDDGWVTMYRNVWKDAGMAAVVTNYAGYFTATLPGSGGYGSGYLTFTVDKLGSVKTAGKLADGTTVSMSGTLALDPAGRVFAVLYTAPTAYKGGYLFGFAEFIWNVDSVLCVRLLEPEAVPIIWESLNPQATFEYGAGFSRELGLAGGKYSSLIDLRSYYENGLSVGGVELPPLAAVVKITDFNEAGTGKVIVNENGIFGAMEGASPNGLVLGITPATGVGTGLLGPRADTPVRDVDTGEYDYTVDITGDGVANTSGLTLTFTRATGLFKGSFKAWYDYVSAEDYTTGLQTSTHTSKTISYEGVLTPVRETGEAEGRGFFLWADKSTYENAAGATVIYGFNMSYDFLLLGQ